MQSFDRVVTVDPDESLSQRDGRKRIRARRASGARRASRPAVPKLTDKRPGSVTDAAHTGGLLSVDFLATCAAMPVALLLLAGVSTAPNNSMTKFGWNLIHDSVFPVAVVAALALSGSYRANRRELGPSTFKELHDLLFAIGAACVLTIGLGALLHATTDFKEPWPTQLIMMVVVAVVFVVIGRSIIRTMLHTLTVSRVIVVGAGTMPERVATYIGLNKGLSLVGRVVDDAEPDDGAIGTVQDLPRLCEELQIRRVIVTYPDRMAHDTIAIYRTLQDSVHLTFVPRYFELVSWRSNLTDLSGLPLIEVARADLSRWDRFLKRSLDVGLSLATLIVLSPVILIVAVAVKLSSPGPILFRQARLGRRQHPFTIFKFRSMRVRQTEAMPSSANGQTSHDLSRPLHELRKKVDEADRITGVGRLLRKSGLDELPQFFNVLRGDMSIVGPRPFVPHESFLEGWSARRFEVRPGITGLWQVSGRNQLNTDDLRQLDYLYVASWSFWWDLKILFDTPRTMVHGFGAY
jgi:exopolysaccharide biosynthesis polyprenyl glycosylphosphotransferase